MERRREREGAAPKRKSCLRHWSVAGEARTTGCQTERHNRGLAVKGPRTPPKIGE